MSGRNDSSKWLEETKLDAKILSEAYRLRIGELWWLNIVTVVAPAILSTLAAIFASLPQREGIVFSSIPLASELAGASAILIAIHKALKCDDFQAECLRLSQMYQSIAVSAGAALAGTGEQQSSRKEILATKLEVLTAGAKAQLPLRFVRKAKKILRESSRDEAAA